MSILREIGIIARALDSIANIEFRDIDLARGQYLYLVRIAENPGIIQEELSDLLKVDRSTVARSVKKVKVYWNSGQLPITARTRNGSSLRREQPSILLS